MLKDIDQQTSLHLNNEAQFLCFTLDDKNPLDLFSLPNSSQGTFKATSQNGTSISSDTSATNSSLAQSNANVAGGIAQGTLQNSSPNGEPNSLPNGTQGQEQANTLSVCPHCGGAVCPHCGNVVDSLESNESNVNGAQVLAHAPHEHTHQNMSDSVYSGATQLTDLTSIKHNSAQNSLITNITSHTNQHTSQNPQPTKSHQTPKDESKSHPHPLLENLESSVFSPTSGQHIGEQLYAINVFKVREIIYYDGEITETAGEKDGLVLGFLTVRGESMPLIDMRRWLYFSSNDPHRDLRPFSINSQKSLVVICHFSSQNIGLKILGVKRIINKNWGEITAGGEFGFDGESKVVATTKYDDGSVIQILDIERMIADAFPDMAESSKLEIDILQSINTDKLILVAEDSSSASKALGLILEKLQVHYMTFANGEGLLDYLYSDGVATQVGAIITDLEMPKISGFEVLKRVKNTPESRHIPVIVNSSMSSDSNVEMAQKLGANAFISKSNPAEVEEHLRKFLI